MAETTNAAGQAIERGVISVGVARAGWFLPGRVLVQLGVIAAVLLCLACAEAQAAWTNGQAADIVLGKANFDSATDNTPSATNLVYAGSGCIDPVSGSLFVVDKHRVLRWSSANAYTSGSAASGVLGQADFTSNDFNRGGLTAANSLAITSYAGCVVSSSGTLFVADYGNNRVLRFDNAAAKENGAAADGVLGQDTFTANGSGTGANRMNKPAYLTLESNGRLWVADENNNRVLRSKQSQRSQCRRCVGTGRFQRIGSK